MATCTFYVVYRVHGTKTWKRSSRALARPKALKLVRALRQLGDSAKVVKTCPRRKKR